MTPSIIQTSFLDAEEIPPDFDIDGWLAGTVKRPGNPKGASE